MLGIIFLMYFLLRALATENFLLFLFEMETIIDILTLPPLFFSVWMERTWLGLRFFRFLIWMNFPDILVYVRVLSNSSSIRLVQVIFMNTNFDFNLFWSLVGFLHSGVPILVCWNNVPPGKYWRPLAGVLPCKQTRAGSIHLPGFHLVSDDNKLHCWVRRHLAQHGAGEGGGYAVCVR